MLLHIGLDDIDVLFDSVLDPATDGPLHSAVHLFRDVLKLFLEHSLEFLVTALLFLLLQFQVAFHLLGTNFCQIFHVFFFQNGRP